MKLITAALMACFGMLSVPFLMAFGFLISLATSLVLSYPLMLAWNYVVPAVFHLSVLSYWQAFSLMIVSTLLWRGVPTNK